jgi:hypothetical protein
MNDPNLVFCPTPDCEHYFNKTTDEKLPSNEIKDEENKSNFICPSCQQNICKVCITKSHEGITCEENKNIKEEINVETKKEHQI